MSKKEPQVISLDITWKALLKLVAMAVAIWAAFSLREIIFMVFVVFIFVAAVSPTIKILQRYMSRGLAVAFFYVLVLLVVLLLFYLFVPAFIQQFNQLGTILPNLFTRLKPFVASFGSSKYDNLLNQTIQQLSGGVQNFGSNFYDTLVGVFGGLAIIVSGIILSFYLLLEENNAREFFHQILPADRYQAIYNTVRKISIQLGAWIRGQLAIMAIMGALNVIAYIILGIPSPLALGIIAGLGEAIPYIGPVLGVLPGVLLALTTGSPIKVLLVVLINYFLMEQIQNFYVTPRVMKKVVGLSPVLVILAILIGATLFGFVGALVALPVAAIVSVIVSDWPNLRAMWEQNNSPAPEE